MTIEESKVCARGGWRSSYELLAQVKGNRKVATPFFFRLRLRLRLCRRWGSVDNRGSSSNSARIGILRYYFSLQRCTLSLSSRVSIVVSDKEVNKVRPSSICIEP